METLSHPMPELAGADDDVIVSQSEAVAGLLIGQSNTLGLALVSGLSDASFADPFPACTLIHRSDDTVEDPPVYDNFGPDILQSWSGTTMGPELSLGRDLDAQGGQWSLIKFAINGAALGDGSAGSVFHPSAVFPSTGDNIFEQVMDFAESGLSSQGATLDFIFWGHGEQDAATSLFAPIYAADLVVFRAAITARLGLVPFLMTRLHPDSDADNTAVVRAQQDYFAATSPLVTLIDTDDLTLFDARHFDADSQVVIGQRVAAARLIASTRTTMSVALSDSPDPVTAGEEMAYSIVVTNTGAVAAANVGVKLELPDGAVYVSGSGTGWSFEEYDDETILARRASGAVGAMPTITITVAAPGGAGDVTATARVVASNVTTVATDSETTTVEASDTWTIDNGIAFPANATEWGALHAASSSGGNPSHLHLLQEASADFADAIGAWTLVAAGTVNYQQAVSGFTRKAVTFGGANTDQASGSGGPNPASESVIEMAVISLTGTPGAESTLFGATTGFYVTYHPALGGVPLIHIGGGAGGGNGVELHTGLQVFAVRHDRTAGTSTFFSAQVKAPLTHDGGGVGTVNGGIGGIDGNNTPTFSGARLMMHVTWRGAAAEKTDQQVFDMLDTMGFAPSWSP